jgi:curved DNA-binding protein CbpA
VEEIRQAYKTLARVIHPDAHPDPASKAAAEIRMQHLNAVAATLTNPEDRAFYDASIRATQRFPPIQVPPGPPVPNEGLVQEGFFQRHILWFATGAVAAGAAAWAYFAGESHLTQIQLSPASRVAAAEPANKPGNPLAVPRRPAAVESAREPGMVGNWLYIAPPQIWERSAQSTTLIVESAQFYLAEQSGNLFGRYSARYGPGGPTQGEVNFTLN